MTVQCHIVVYEGCERLRAEDDVLRIVLPLRAEQLDMAVHLRGDCGFGLPKMYQVCEDHQLIYTFGLATNSRLKERRAAAKAAGAAVVQ